MKYFNELPLVINSDGQGNYYLLRNILIRTKLIPELAKNPLLFYQYDIQESDTPETIAYKYYGDSYRYWMVLMANEIMDPQWEWPLTSKQFSKHLIDKYSSIAGGDNLVMTYLNSTVHHYEKSMTTIDSNTGTTAIKTVTVDQQTYQLIQPSSTTSILSDGSKVTYTVGGNAVSIYDYENDLNESKRTIKLINSKYVSEMEATYSNLVKKA
jgi:hypothetical protein